MRCLNQWSALRWLLAGSWLFTTIRVAIPDYPYDWPLWYSLTMDPNGFWHEAFYIAVGFLVMIDITYHWEMRKKRFRVVRSTPIDGSTRPPP